MIKLTISADPIIEAIKSSSTVIIDCETSSLHPWRDGKVLAGIGVKPLGGPSFYLPVRHAASSNAPLGELRKLGEALRGKELIAHNIKFDLAAVYQDGINLAQGNKLTDTLVLLRLVVEDESTYELKKLAKKYIDEQADEQERNLKALMKKQGWSTYDQIPAELIKNYVEKDLEYPEHFYTRVYPQLVKRGLQPLFKLEQELTQVLFEMETRGFALDVTYVTEQLKEIRGLISNMEQEAFKLARKSVRRKFKELGLPPPSSLSLDKLREKASTSDKVGKAYTAALCLKQPLCQAHSSNTCKRCPNDEGVGEFNVHGPHDVRKVFEGIGLRSTKTTPKGTSSWSKISLGGMDHPIAELVVKIRAAYNIESFYEQFLKLKSSNDIIHPSFFQAGARTGRASCVPLDTEILTREGWKTWDRLTLGEEVLGYNLTTDRLEWAELQGIHREKTPVGELKFRRWQSLKKTRGPICTADHLWVVKNKYFKGLMKAEDAPTRRGEADLSLIAGAEPGESLEGTSTITPQEAAFLGWMLTDGHVDYLESGSVRASVGVKKPSSIWCLDALTKALDYSIQRYTYKKKDGAEVVVYSLKTKETKKYFDKINYHSCSLQEIVTSLSTQARQAMYNAMMEGDGAWRRSVFAGTKNEVCEAFLTICALLGKPTSYRFFKIRSGKTLTSVNIFDKKEVPQPRFNLLNRKEEVWCPKTSLGTWVMKQHRIVSITGNCRGPNLQQIPRFEGYTGSLTGALAAMEKFKRLQKKAQQEKKKRYEQIGRQQIIFADEELETQLTSAFEGKLFGKVRGSFIPRPGHFLLLIDWSQIELRIFAAYAGEQDLLDTFEFGLDIHTMAAISAFGSLPKDKESQQFLWLRNMGKQIAFGLLYGMGTTLLAAEIGRTKKEAQEFMDKYFARFKYAKRFIEETQDKIRSTARRLCLSHRRVNCQRCEPEQFAEVGYVADLWGRRRYLPVRDAYKAVNFLIQGCLPADTRVLTPDGWIPIGDVEDQLTIWTGERWAPAMRLNKGPARRVRLFLSDGTTFDCDDRHKLLIKNPLSSWPKWEDVNKITGAELIRDSGAPQKWGQEIADVSDWYWMGRMLGDGWYAADGRWGCAFGYAKADQEAAQAMLEWLSTKDLFGPRGEAGVYPILDQRDGVSYIVGFRGGHTLKSKALWESFGLVKGAKARTKRLPPLVFTLDRKRRQAIFDGYYGADGTKYRERFRLASVNKELLADCVKLLHTLGVEASVHRGKIRETERYTLVKSVHPRPLIVDKIVYLEEETMYTLSVDDERHAFSTERLISKNSAADLMKEAMVRCRRLLKDCSFKTMPLVTIHDEVIFEVPWEEAEKVIPLLVDEMSTCSRIKAKLKCDVAWTPERWSKKRKLDCDTCEGMGHLISLAGVKEDDVKYTLLVALYGNDRETLAKASISPCQACDQRGYDLGKLRHEG